MRTFFALAKIFFSEFKFNFNLFLLRFEDTIAIVLLISLGLAYNILIFFNENVATNILCADLLPEVKLLLREIKLYRAQYLGESDEFWRFKRIFNHLILIEYLKEVIHAKNPTHLDAQFEMFQNLFPLYDHTHAVLTRQARELIGYGIINHSELKNRDYNEIMQVAVCDLRIEEKFRALLASITLGVMDYTSIKDFPAYDYNSLLKIKDNDLKSFLESDFTEHYQRITYADLRTLCEALGQITGILIDYYLFVPSDLNLNAEDCVILGYHPPMGKPLAQIRLLKPDGELLSFPNNFDISTMSTIMTLKNLLPIIKIYNGDIVDLDERIKHCIKIRALITDMDMRPRVVKGHSFKEVDLFVNPKFTTEQIFEFWLGEYNHHGTVERFVEEHNPTLTAIEYPFVRIMYYHVLYAIREITH